MSESQERMLLIVERGESGKSSASLTDGGFIVSLSDASPMTASSASMTERDMGRRARGRLSWSLKFPLKPSPKRPSKTCRCENPITLNGAGF
jgi:hypothetical protein